MQNAQNLEKTAQAVLGSLHFIFDVAANKLSDWSQQCNKYEWKPLTSTERLHAISQEQKSCFRGK